MNPALKLKPRVPAKRQIAKSKPIVPTLKKKISGSIEGDAIQKAITGVAIVSLLCGLALNQKLPFVNGHSICLLQSKTFATIMKQTSK